MPGIIHTNYLQRFLWNNFAIIQLNTSLLFAWSYPTHFCENFCHLDGNHIWWRVWLSWRLCINFWTLFFPSGLLRRFNPSRPLLMLSALARLQLPLSPMSLSLTSSTLSVVLEWRDCDSRCAVSQPIWLSQSSSISRWGRDDRHWASTSQDLESSLFRNRLSLLRSLKVLCGSDSRWPTPSLLSLLERKTTVIILPLAHPQLAIACFIMSTCSSPR